MNAEETTQRMIDEGYSEGKKSFEYQWNKIEKHFRWERVYSVMKALDWHWHIHNEEYGIPRIDTMKKHARKLLYDIYQQDKGNGSCGGFRYGVEDGQLWLTFEIEEAHTMDL